MDGRGVEHPVDLPLGLAQMRPAGEVDLPGVGANQPADLVGQVSQREGDQPRSGAHRRECRERVLEGTLIDAEEPKVALGEQRLDPWAVRALGQPDAAWRPEASPVR